MIYEMPGSTRTIRGKVTRHFAILPRSGNPRVDRARQDTLRPLGTSVLWVNDFTEIPLHLGEVYRSAGTDWQAVY